MKKNSPLLKVNTDKSMTEAEVSRVGAIVKILKDTSHYHATSFADIDIALLLKVIQTWPPAMMFPGKSSLVINQSKRTVYYIFRFP